MREYVVDTHSLLWHIFQSNRLSRKAASILGKADQGKAIIYIPGIVLVEIVYLIEKSRIPDKAIETILNLLNEPALNYRFVPLTLETVRALQTVPRQFIPDLPDRLPGLFGVIQSVPDSARRRSRRGRRFASHR